MQVTLLGTGDTTGTPTPSCDCDTCEEAEDRGIERSRFSVHVRNERTDETLLSTAVPICVISSSATTSTSPTRP